MLACRAGRLKCMNSYLITVSFIEGAVAVILKAPLKNGKSSSFHFKRSDSKKVKIQVLVKIGKDFRVSADNF